MKVFEVLLFVVLAFVPCQYCQGDSKTGSKKDLKSLGEEDPNNTFDCATHIMCVLNKSIEYKRLVDKGGPMMTKRFITDFTNAWKLQPIPDYTEATLEDFFKNTYPIGCGKKERTNNRNEVTYGFIDYYKEVCSCPVCVKNPSGSGCMACEKNMPFCKEGKCKTREEGGDDFCDTEECKTCKSAQDAMDEFFLISSEYNEECNNGTATKGLGKVTADIPKRK